jgi:histone H3/H4
MSTKKQIKKLARVEGKKIGQKSLEKIKEKINLEIKRIIKSASRKADFSGRTTIKPEDIGE